MATQVKIDQRSQKNCCVFVTYREDTLPQLETISNFLKRKSIYIKAHIWFLKLVNKTQEGRNISCRVSWSSNSI